MALPQSVILFKQPWLFEVAGLVTAVTMRFAIVTGWESGGGQWWGQAGGDSDFWTPQNMSPPQKSPICRWPEGCRARPSKMGSSESPGVGRS